MLPSCSRGFCLYSRPTHRITPRSRPVKTCNAAAAESNSRMKSSTMPRLVGMGDTRTCARTSWSALPALSASGYEGRVVAHVEIQVSTQRIAIQHRPTATGNAIAFVEPLPREIYRRFPIVNGRATIHRSLHRTELKPAPPIGAYRQIGLSHKVDEVLIPLCHLNDTVHPCCSHGFRHRPSLLSAHQMPLSNPLQQAWLSRLLSAKNFHTGGKRAILLAHACQIP